jgi:hypothetical protein
MGISINIMSYKKYTKKDFLQIIKNDRDLNLKEFEKMKLSELQNFLILLIKIIKLTNQLMLIISNTYFVYVVPIITGPMRQAKEIDVIAWIVIKRTI